MKNKTIIILLLVCTVLLGFTTNNYFLITKKDVELNVPKGFPKPNYKFKNNDGE